MCAPILLTPSQRLDKAASEYTVIVQCSMSLQSGKENLRLLTLQLLHTFDSLEKITYLPGLELSAELNHVES